MHEKILATIALQSIHSRNCSIVDEAIKVVLDEKKVRSIKNLTSQDLFNVKVTHVQDILHTFIKLINRQVNQESAPLRLQTILIDVNAVLLAMINEINSFHAKNTPTLSSKFEYLPWTSISGKNGAYDPIIQLIHENLKESLKTITAPNVRQKYYLQLAELIDFVLDSKQRYLQSIRVSAKLSFYSFIIFYS